MAEDTGGEYNESGGELRFATDLWDGFDHVSRRTDMGLQACRDILNFVRKRAEIEAEYAKKLQKLSQTSASQTSGLFTQKLNAANNQQGSTANGWKAMLIATEKQAGIHQQVAISLEEKVAHAMMSFVKDMEATRKQLVTDGTKITREFRDIMESLQRSKQLYERAAKEQEVAKLSHDEAQTNSKLKPKDLVKSSSNVTKKTQGKQVADEDYKYKVKVANAFQERYHTEAMPKILDDFQHLETVRIHLLKANMKKFVRILEDIPPAHAQELRACKQVVEAIDNEADIEAFIIEHRSGEVPPPPIEYEEYEEQGAQKLKPSKSIWDKRMFGGAAGAAGKKETPDAGPGDLIKSRPRPMSMMLPKTATSVFRCTLAEVMAKEDPSAKIPRIVAVLCEAILRLKGTRQEGIFRVPADVGSVKEMRIQIDAGDYDITTSDVNVPAALLKLWFREMTDPLVPVEFYRGAVACGIDHAAACAVAATLPEHNLNVAKYVCAFLRTLSRPQHVTFTKMTPENLAMVFAPSFLRCPSDDPSEILKMSESERNFVLNLINHLAVNEEDPFNDEGTGPRHAPVSSTPVTEDASSVSAIMASNNNNNTTTTTTTTTTSSAALQTPTQTASTGTTPTTPGPASSLPLHAQELMRSHLTSDDGSEPNTEDSGQTGTPPTGRVITPPPDNGGEDGPPPLPERPGSVFGGA